VFTKGTFCVTALSGPRALAPAFRRTLNSKLFKARTATSSQRPTLSPLHSKQTAQNVTTERLEEYVDSRIREGAANATVNRELACLKTAFRIGYGKRHAVQ
jgi:site-specific recombinase XerD